MKFKQLFWISILFQIFIFASYAFTGNSSTYNLSSSISSMGGSENISNSFIIGKGASPNYYLKLGTVNYTFCTEDWSYSSWSGCSSGTQTRFATDANSCGTINTREIISQSCSSEESGGSSGGGSGGSSSSSTPSSGSSSYVSNPSLSSTVEPQPEIVNELEVGNILFTTNQNFKNKYDIKINEQVDMSQNFEGKQRVKINDKSQNQNVLEFDYDFSKSSLNLDNLQIETGTIDKSYTIVRGLNLDGETKTIRVLIGSSSQTVCIKDAEVSSIEEISSTCNATNEYILSCDGTLQGNYQCSVDENYYSISGLKHSAILEYEQEEVIEGNLSLGVEKEIATENNTMKYIIFGVVGLLLIIIIFIVLAKRKNTQGKNSQIQQTSFSTDLRYNAAKKYVQEYKTKYSKEQLYQSLQKAGYPEDILRKVFQEEY